MITAASLEAANYTIHLHRTLIGVIKGYAAAGCSRKTLQLCTRIFVMTNFTGLLRMRTTRQTGTISIRLTGRAQMQVAANLLHTLVRRSSLIISIYRNHVHRRIARNRQRHGTGQLRRIALLCAIRILHLILVICHQCCIHEHHIVVRIIRILDRYFLACRFCCTNSKGMTGIKFNTAAGLNQRCNIFKARHDIKTKRTGCRYCYSIILTVSDSGLRVSDIAVIHLRKMRRRLQNRHYLRVGVAGANAFDLREHGIVVYICRCNRQIAVALVIVCPVILPAAELAVRRNRCLTARGARTRFFIKLTNLQKLLVEGLLLAVLNVVYLFHTLLVAVKIADSIVQNTAVVDESAAQPAVMALIRAVQDRQLLTAVHRADFIHTAGNEQIFLGVHAVRCNSRYRDRILHIVTLGAGIGKAIGDNFCCLAFFCPRIILRVRAVLIAVRQQLALVKVAVLIITILIVVANRNNFRRHAAARRIADITDGYTRKASTTFCAVATTQQCFFHHLLPFIIVIGIIVVVDRQIGFLVVGILAILCLLQVIDIDRHCQLVDTVHIHVADFHINAQMRAQLVIAVAIMVQHGLQRLSAAVDDVTEVDYATVVSQCAAAERILLNAVYSSRILVIARRIDHQRVLAVTVKVACGQTQHSTGLVEFQVLDVPAVIIVTDLNNVRYLAVLVRHIQTKPFRTFIKYQIRNVFILAGAVRIKRHSRNTLGIADIGRVAPPERRHLTALAVGCALVCRLELIRVHAGYNQLVVLEQRNPSQRAVWVIPQCGWVCYARFFFRGQTKAVSCCCSIRCRRLRQHDLRQQTRQHTAYQQQTANSFFHLSSSLPYEINGFHGFPLALPRSTVRGYRYFTVLSV